MENFNTVIAVLPDHRAAEAAIKKLAQAGFDLKSLSVIGHGYQTCIGKIGWEILVLLHNSFDRS